jgi:hypothetical protein
MFSLSSSTGVTTCSNKTSTPFLDHYGSSCLSDSIAFPLPTGVWNFVCYQYNGSDVTFYGQNNSIAQPLNGWGIPNIAIGTNTGSSSTTYKSFEGNMDEVSLWSSVLTPSQLAALYNGGAGCKAHQ